MSQQYTWTIQDKHACHSSECHVPNTSSVYILISSFSLIGKLHTLPNGFRTMTSPSTHFYGQRKCHLSQSSLAIYGLFSEKSFNSSSNFFYKPNITILSDKVRSGQTILFFLTEKLYTPNGFWTYDFILRSHLWEKVPFETKLIGAISCQNDERSNRPDRLISSPS